MKLNHVHTLVIPKLAGDPYRTDSQKEKVPEINKLNEPEHYKINGMNTIKVIIQLADAAGDTTEEKIYLFNAFKYLIRHKKKNGIEDLEKAVDYINRLMKLSEINMN